MIQDMTGYDFLWYDLFYDMTLKWFSSKLNFQSKKTLQNTRKEKGNNKICEKKNFLCLYLIMILICPQNQFENFVIKILQ